MRLEDRLTVCVFRDGRAPHQPVSGKDHWTLGHVHGCWGSRGQVIGGYDSGLVGQRVDLNDEGLDPNGTALSLSTLETPLALAGVIPMNICRISPIYAAINNN